MFLPFPHLRTVLAPLAAIALATASAEAQTSYTLAAGYIQVTIPGNTLGTVSATLTNKSEFAGNVTLGAYSAGSPGSQTITVSPSPGWTAGQWANATDPHVIYIKDSNGAEEAFLITANGTDSVTVTTRFDLASRYPATPGSTIRKAQTLASVFGTPASSPLGTGTSSTGDAIYIWTGTSWQRFYINSTRTQWRTSGFGDQSNVVVFPDEGAFVQNTSASPVTFTIFGDVPASNQITTIEGAGLYFVSMHYPVEVTLGSLGFQNLPDWVTGTSSTGDAVFVWNPGPPGSWTRYYYNASGEWRTSGFGDKTNTPIAPDTAVFVQRVNANPIATSGNVHVLPYTP